MAEEQPDSKVIQKKDSRFPDWLNFDKLRAEGIDHISKLSGNIWTDHNAHDPGITVLEMLCYALLDLGYRTALPDEDMFASDPSQPEGGSDFFTPSAAMTCNPITIADYRRMLIDIPGIRNAWMEVNDWLIEQPDGDRISKVDTGRSPCHDMFRATAREGGVTSYGFLNGLYHVYVDLEKNVETDFNTASGKEELDRIRKDISRTLQSHRNLCEDFIDLTVLCKLEIGVEAEIELDSGADPDKVYLKIIESLRQFFSPSPRFYTLQALLEKGKRIEHIYAGRPYDIKQSHGFVDPEEFEDITIRKEIHVSDVYYVIFDVPGVSAVRGLKIRPDKCKDKHEWRFSIPKYHVAEFKKENSILTFIQNGVAINVGKVSSLGPAGKALHESPSPYLDAVMPKGIYRHDLDHYYSIQNEFPEVYKVGEGQLIDNTPDQRKAQVYQLKGYLLFFDQLLADYLSQLKNTRTLLSLSQPTDKKEDHTYFINQLSTVPDIGKLTRFNNTDTAEPLQQGKLLAFPVDRKALEELVKKEKITDADIRKIAVPYMCASSVDCAMELAQLTEDLSQGDHLPRLIKTFTGCYFFYFITTSSRIALMGTGEYKTERQATRDADLVLVSSAFPGNYRSHVNPTDQSHSFDLDLNLFEHNKLLRWITDGNGYVKRKQQFMDHLLARFAERFTDYAMLSYGFLDANKLVQQDISAKKRFLGAYPELSSTRGKSYDYKVDGWNSDNVSGIEKRFSALTGIEKWERANHCHFDVVPFEGQVYTHIKSIEKEEYDILKGVDKLVSDEVRTKDAWVYRLYEKNRYKARYLPGGTDDAEKQKKLIKDVLQKYPAEYTILELCYGGTIFRERKQAKTKTKFYHYEIRCRNRWYTGGASQADNTGQELVLFESVHGYASKEEAQQAFEGNYMKILSLGMKETSYGAEISFKEIFTYGSQAFDDKASIVFIPKETMEEYGNHDDNVMSNLIVHAKSFPVRAIKKNSKEFAPLFSCKVPETDLVIGPITCRKTKPEKDVFYFVLSEISEVGIPGAIADAWISDDYYDTVAETLEAFNFFLLLLRYKGNYHFAQDCDCNWQLYIHEILAISERIFETKELAWGEEGVEKFISVAQTENSFHSYFDKDFCRYTFYTACEDSGIVHPCTYETLQKRDLKLQQLYEAAQQDSFLKPVWKWDALSEELKKVLEELDKTSGPLSADQVLDIFDNIGNGELDDKLKELEDELRKQLAVFIGQYPLARHTCCGKEHCYNVLLRLPNDSNEKDDDCANGNEVNNCGCSIAWESHLCYKTAAEAEEHLEQLPSILKDASIYLPVFKCPCDGYGIRIQRPCRTVQNQSINSCNDVLAYNPQYYTSTHMVCEAVERSQKLINDEGIHLIEHILLRPAGTDECADLIPSCPGTQCDFDWPVEEEDHCKEENKKKKIRFLPGEDPYSFIATVVLPAWPRRFRKKENRLLLENILQREVPAHIMIRVIWLRPSDLCKFEYLFMNWIVEKSGRKACADDYSKKQFIEFLFQTKFNCLSDDHGCDPCKPETIDDENESCKWLHMVNRLYCWSDTVCGIYQADEFVKARFDFYKHKLEEYLTDAKELNEAAKLLHSNGPSVGLYNMIAVVVMKAETNGTITSKLANDKEVKAMTRQYRQGNIATTDTFFGRKGIPVFKEMQKQATAAEKILKKIAKFMDVDDPSDDQSKQDKKYIILMTAVLDAKTNESITPKLANNIAVLITGYYLDNISLRTKKWSSLDEAARVFEKMRESGIDMQRIFSEWKQNEVQVQQPDVDVYKVYRLLNFSKK